MTYDKNKSEENQPKVKTIYVALKHEIYGYMGEYQIIETANHLGYKITKGPLNPCEACAT